MVALYYAIGADEVYDDAGNELTAYIRDPVPRLEGDVSQLDQDHLRSLVHKHSAANELDFQTADKYFTQADDLRARRVLYKLSSMSARQRRDST